MKPPTILIVEDDAGARAGLTMAIEAAGFAVRELSNGRDALAFLRMTRIEKPFRASSVVRILKIMVGFGKGPG
jgi:DNA-binding response OmpR family regulator